MILTNIYILVWILLSLIGLVLIIKNRKQILLFKKEYVLFILKKWKIFIFFIGLFFLSFIANLGLDPSWDIPMTIIMSLLTYYTAPYSSGIIYRYIKGINKNKVELFISIILVLFSSAWFYDAYATILLLGYYPPMAFSNLGLSPFFYLFAGIMWNLDYSKKEGVIFVYTKEEWIKFKGDKGTFTKLIPYILPIVLFICYIFGYFVYLNY